jgi:tRNA modification GTPase
VSDTAVSLLTPPGTGAIAVVEARGPWARATARALFSKPLPEVGGFRFGALAGDEVVLSATEPDAVEVHCHGGARVARLVLDAFVAAGCEERTPRPKDEGFELLQRALTLRTANVLLDQLNGAFALEIQRLLALLETDPASAAEPLHRFADLGHFVGRYLVNPWRVVIAGAPNVGKSSLVNALAGYQRSVVSEVPGTTRDAVSVRVAFDGWPVELIDTAGMRDASGLEAEGIERARKELETANRLVWVIDATDPRAHVPDLDCDLPTDDEPIVVANKCDRPAACDTSALPYFDGTVRALRVSALTGEGVAELARAIVADVPQVPPGGAVPYTPRLIQLVNEASRGAHFEKWDEVTRALRAALS